MLDQRGDRLKVGTSAIDWLGLPNFKPNKLSKLSKTQSRGNRSGICPLSVPDSNHMLSAIQ